jgi:integrase
MFDDRLFEFEGEFFMAVSEGLRFYLVYQNTIKGFLPKNLVPFLNDQIFGQFFHSLSKDEILKLNENISLFSFLSESHEHTEESDKPNEIVLLKEHISNVLNRLTPFLSKARRQTRATPKNIVKKSNGIYYYRKVVDGKRFEYTLHTRDLEEAERVAESLNKKNVENFVDLKSQEIASRLVDKKSEKTGKNSENTVEYLSKKWIRTLDEKGQALTSLSTKKKTIQHLQSLNVKYVKDINQSVVDKFVKHLDAEKLGPGSQKKYFTDLKTFLSYCSEEGAYSLDLKKTLKFPLIKDQASDIKFSNEELLKIFAYAKKDPEFHLYLNLLFYALIRPSEAMYLRINNFDFENDQITIFISKTAKKGKDEKKIPLLPDLKEIVLEYIETQKKTNFLFSVANHLDDNITKQQIIHHLQRNSQAKRDLEVFGHKFKVLKRELKLNPKFTLREFRKTAETIFAREGVDLNIYAAMAFHSPVTAMKNYTKFKLELDKEKLKDFKMLKK